MKKRYLFLAAATIVIVLVTIIGNEKRFYISDDYYFSSVSRDYGVFSMTGPHIFCNAGCPSDLQIDEIEEIYWNRSTILLRRSNKYYIVLARGKELMCCANDSINGPLSEKEYKDNIAKLKLDFKRFKHREFY